jgi:hypothetical protein
MKRIIYFLLSTVLLILLTNNTINSTEVTITGEKLTVVYRVYDSGGDEYGEESLTGNDIGTAYSSQFQLTESCRTLFRFNLSSIPTDATINSVVLFFQNSASTQYSQVFTEAVSKSSISEQWSEIGGAYMLFDDPISYGSNNITSSYLTDLIVGDIGGNSYIGAFSTDEDQTDSFSGLTLKVIVNYGTTPSALNITAENIMGTFKGGQIKVGVGETATNRTSPYPFSTAGNNTINLGAIENQSYGGYNWIWNDTEAVNYKSKWTRKAANGTRVDKFSGINYSFSAAADDDGSTYEANLRKMCNVTFGNQFSGTSAGGSIEVNGVNQSGPHTANVVEQNTIRAVAPHYQDIEDIKYLFDQWSDGTQNRDNTFNIAQHENLTAQYTGYAIFDDVAANGNNRNLRISSGAGNKIQLDWDEHPNALVTQYYIYRFERIRGQGDTPVVQIGVRTRGNTTFTDTEYLYSTSSRDSELFYNVKAYYSVDGTIAGGDDVQAFGESSGVLTKDNSENNTQDLIVTNYDIGNFPNPFNPTTRINYQLPEQGHVTIKVYDMLGKEVAELVNETKESGIYNAEFNASNLSSGVYVYTIQVDAMSETSKSFFMSKKMLMLK